MKGPATFVWFSSDVPSGGSLLPGMKADYTEDEVARP